MTNPENGFDKGLASHVVNSEAQEDELLQKHFEEQLLPLTLEKFTALTLDWKIDRNEELGFQLYQRAGVIDDVLNTEGEEIRIIVIFSKESVLNNNYSTDPEAQRSVQKEKDSFKESIAVSVNTNSVLTMDKNNLSRKNNHYVLRLPIPNWMQPGLLRGEKPSPEMEQKAQTGFSPYGLLDETTPDTTPWEEERYEELGFLVKKRVTEVQKEQKIVHGFMHIYLFTPGKELSNEACEQISVLIDNFNSEVQKDADEENAVPLVEWAIKKDPIQS